MKILFLGDIVGESGCIAVEKYLPSKISNYKLIKGDIIALHTSGGGGYGLKSERDIKRINFDQKNYKD